MSSTEAPQTLFISKIATAIKRPPLVDILVRLIPPGIKLTDIWGYKLQLGAGAVNQFGEGPTFQGSVTQRADLGEVFYFPVGRTYPLLSDIVMPDGGTYRDSGTLNIISDSVFVYSPGERAYIPPPFSGAPPAPGPAPLAWNDASMSINVTNIGQTGFMVRHSITNKTDRVDASLTLSVQVIDKTTGYTAFLQQFPIALAAHDAIVKNVSVNELMNGRSYAVTSVLVNRNMVPVATTSADVKTLAITAAPVDPTTPTDTGALVQAYLVYVAQETSITQLQQARLAWTGDPEFYPIPGVSDGQRSVILQEINRRINQLQQPPSGPGVQDPDAPRRDNRVLIGLGLTIAAGLGIAAAAKYRK